MRISFVKCFYFLAADSALRRKKGVAVLLVEIFPDVLCKSGFVDFVHRLYFNKITTFRKLDLLPSSGKKKTETLAFGPPG
jgi:hypothetical protein